MPTPKKSIEKHLIDGTFRPNRHGASTNRAAPQPKAPVKPTWLSDAAAAEWERVCGPLVADGYLTEHDQTALAAYCELHSQFIADPKEFTAAKMAQLRLLMADLGMSSSGRARLPGKREIPQANPFGTL